MRIEAILLDLGDTIMSEATEVKDAELNTLEADLIPGMADVLRELRASGHRLALVADTKTATYKNVLGRHGLFDLFEAFAISDELGFEKPDPRMFRHALRGLSVPPEDHGRVLMVGNNLARDIAGANELGLISVWFHWNERHPTLPVSAREVPAHTIRQPADLLSLVRELESPRSSEGEDEDEG